MKLNKNGATSVLIIMLMVVLMVFGLTILTTTLSNDKLSSKKLAWLTDYYALEADAAIKLADMDESISALKAAAIVGSTDPSRAERFKALLKAELLADQELNVLLTASETQGDYLKYIDMTIACIVPSDTLTDELFLAADNYRLIKYQQTQDLFDYEDIQFGNPFAPETE